MKEMPLSQTFPNVGFIDAKAGLMLADEVPVILSRL